MKTDTQKIAEKYIKRMNLGLLIANILILIFCFKIFYDITDITGILYEKYDIITKVCFELDKAMSCDAKLKIAEAVGIGSILLTWLNNILDRTEAGISYSDLLQASDRKIGLCIAIHIISLAVCIWQCKMNRSFNALLALLTDVSVLASIFKSINLLVIHPEYRRYMACMWWDNTMQEKFNNTEKNK